MASDPQEVSSVNAPRDTTGSTPTESTPTTGGSTPTLHGKTDPAWEHFAFKKDGKTNVYTWLHCTTTYRGGGINRMKHHHAGIKGNISSCKKVLHDVRHQMQELLKGIEKKKSTNDHDLNDAYDDQINEEEEVQQVEEVQPILNPIPNKGKRKANVLVDSFFAPRITPGSQPTLKSVYSSKEAVHKAEMAIARGFYDCNIPFNATKSPYFQAVADAIAAIGLGFKVPSFYALRINLLGDCNLNSLHLNSFHLFKFVVLGLMHELILYYLGRSEPTFRMTWFFVLHGLCLTVEMALKKVLTDKWRLPRLVSGPLTAGFVFVTCFWLFLPEFIRCRVHVKSLEEYAALGAFVKNLTSAF